MKPLTWRQSGRSWRLFSDLTHDAPSVGNRQFRHFSRTPVAGRPSKLSYNTTSITPTRCAQQFSTSPYLQKKKNKTRDADDTPAQDSSSPAAQEVDPFDLSILESDLDSALERLKNALSQLRSGGRFNPAALEALRVQPEKDNKATYPLRDLVQVVPRGGRELHLLVNDSAHVKPVTSAVLGSDLNLTPQPDPTGQNAQLLVVKIPPPTAESRKKVVEAAGKAGSVAADAVRNARGTQQKKFRKMELDRVVRKDDLRKAHSNMEDLVRKKGDEVKKIVDAAKKALDA
ncbi:ribosome recycling factor [Myriangium duriaei CBS 260.36]|uniref:Ribosome recycling factor n=1 Tax=Myriangium duriaei CBS 260.36 TaxID=1168546 RepID=A0A9P4IY24_9PEZI|nr:ribosome recycling factor [Myriangium duriaei CBS 260.36]